MLLLMSLKLKLNILKISGNTYLRNMKKENFKHKMWKLLRTVSDNVTGEPLSPWNIRKSWRIQDLHSAAMILQKQHPLFAFLSPFGLLILSDFVAATEERRFPYNPDADLNTPQTIRRHGYPAEAHAVETEDGYLLTLHRIPGGRRKKPSHTACDPSRQKNPSQMMEDMDLQNINVEKSIGLHLNEENSSESSNVPPFSKKRVPILLQHGLMGSSYSWIIAGPGKGLAYLLADADYDVWMGNARGNTYSRAHICFPTDPSSSFWDFSFHEVALYDVPAEVEYILRVTGAPSVHYVGHSMGTTVFFAMAALRPDVARKVASAHLLAPVVFSSRVKSPLRLLAPYAKDVEYLARLLGRGQLLPDGKLTKLLAKYGCDTLNIEKKLCRNFIFILYGFDADQFDLDLLPLFLQHASHGASTKTIIHYAQLVNSGEFQPFDYGPELNHILYNSTYPPPYDLSKINVPVHLYYASNDWLSSTQDVEELFDTLEAKKTKYLVPLPSFNHIDFLLAKDVKSLLYDAILRQLRF